MDEDKACAEGSFQVPFQVRNRMKIFSTARFRCVSGL